MFDASRRKPIFQIHISEFAIDYKNYMKIVMNVLTNHNWIGNGLTFIVSLAIAQLIFDFSFPIQFQPSIIGIWPR